MPSAEFPEKSPKPSSKPPNPPKSKFPKPLLLSLFWPPSPEKEKSTCIPATYSLSWGEVC